MNSFLLLTYFRERFCESCAFETERVQQLCFNSCYKRLDASFMHPYFSLPLSPPLVWHNIRPGIVKVLGHVAKRVPLNQIIPRYTHMLGEPIGCPEMKFSVPFLILCDEVDNRIGIFDNERPVASIHVDET